VAIETITHFMMGVSSYIILSFINWSEVYKIICKIDMSMPTKITNQIDRKMTKILRETQQICKFTSLFVTILGTVLGFCDLCGVFILNFVENIIDIEHKHQGNTNATNKYELLLLEKYPFSCWTPFDEKSIMAHIAIYIYTAVVVFMMALKAGSVISVLFSTVIYISLQFKFVSKSLEDLSNTDDSDSQIEQNTFSTLEKQHTCEEFSYRNCQVSATDGESFQTPSQEQIPECFNVQQYRDTSITTAHCVMDQEHKKDSDRLPSDNKSSPEDCVKIIIKNHQEAIW